MTYSEFNNRLNYYFNSTDKDSLSVLAEIFDGVVRPTMTKHEKKVLYKVIKQYYSEIYFDYTLTNLLKSSNPEGFSELYNAMSKKERVENNFYYIIFFEDKVF